MPGDRRGADPHSELAESLEAPPEFRVKGESFRLRVGKDGAVVAARQTAPARSSPRTSTIPAPAAPARRAALPARPAPAAKPPPPAPPEITNPERSIVRAASSASAEPVVTVDKRAPLAHAHRSYRWNPSGSQHHRATSAGHLLRKHYGGWRRSPFDPRRLIADTFGIPLRTEVDPRNELPPVFDQGKLGSCTANATAAAFEYDSMLDGFNNGPLSRLWIYYQERKLEGVLGNGDTGARGSDAFAVARNIGIPSELAWPYDINTFAGPPPARAEREENYYRLTKPYATPPISRHSFKQVFSNQQTISFGFTVFESFESSAVAKSGIVPMPKPGEAILGGHEVLAVGYLKSEQDYVLVRNSWGSRKSDGKPWGLDGSGYCLMPWRMILDPAIAGDWTTIIRPIARR